MPARIGAVIQSAVKNRKSAARASKSGYASYLKSAQQTIRKKKSMDPEEDIFHEEFDLFSKVPVPPPPVPDEWVLPHQETVFHIYRENSWFVTCLIISNFIILVTFSTNPNKWLETVVDYSFAFVFLLELLFNWYGRYPWFFWKDGWNCMDFFIVLSNFVSIIFSRLIPSLVFLRVIRILRILRVMGKIPKLRKIVECTIRALPSVFWAFVLLLIFNCMFALAGYTLFHERDPWLGSGDSNYDTSQGGSHPFKDFWAASFTMFQVLTCDSWASSIARPLMRSSDYFEACLASIFFITFVLCVVIVFLNVFLTILIDSFYPGNDGGMFGSADMAPLPYGWEKHIDKETGRPFYFNRHNHSSQWERPRDGKKEEFETKIQLHEQLEDSYDTWIRETPMPLHRGQAAMWHAMKDEKVDQLTALADELDDLEEEVYGIAKVTVEVQGTAFILSRDLVVTTTYSPDIEAGWTLIKLGGKRLDNLETAIEQLRQWEQEDEYYEATFTTDKKDKMKFENQGELCYHILELCRKMMTRIQKQNTQIAVMFHKQIGNEEDEEASDGRLPDILDQMALDRLPTDSDDMAVDTAIKIAHQVAGTPAVGDNAPTLQFHFTQANDSFLLPHPGRQNNYGSSSGMSMTDNFTSYTNAIGSQISTIERSRRPHKKWRRERMKKKQQKTMLNLFDTQSTYDYVSQSHANLLTPAMTPSTKPNSTKPKIINQRRLSRTPQVRRPPPQKRNTFTPRPPTHTRVTTLTRNLTTPNLFKRDANDVRPTPRSTYIALKRNDVRDVVPPNSTRTVKEGKLPDVVADDNSLHDEPSRVPRNKTIDAGSVSDSTATPPHIKIHHHVPINTSLNASQIELYTKEAEEIRMGILQDRGHRQSIPQSSEFAIRMDAFDKIYLA